MLPLAIAVALALLAGACSGDSTRAKPEGDESMPPAAFLRPPGGGAVEGTLGSYCWAVERKTICRDSPIATPGASVPLTARSGIAFSFSGARPGSTSVSWLKALSGPSATKDGACEWADDFDGDARDTGTNVPPTAGRYILSVFAAWDGKGDASYAWCVEVK